MGTTRYRDGEGGFRLTLPPGWESEKDADGGLLVSREEGTGLLHLIPFSQGSDEAMDPGEELYAFLEDQEIELEEDEIEDIDLPEEGLLALCEYVTEEEDEATYWMVGVAAGPGQLVLASYSCPERDENAEREAVRAILVSLVLEGTGGS